MYAQYIANLYSLGVMLISDTCMAIIHEVDIADGCVLSHFYKNVGSI